MRPALVQSIAMVIAITAVPLSPVAASSIGAGSCPHSSRAGVRCVSVNDRPPTLHCRPMEVCIVALPPGERVISKSVGESLYWEIVDTAYGDAAQNSIVLIRSKVSSEDHAQLPWTDLVITTSGPKGTYQVGVQPDARAPFPSEIDFYVPVPPPSMTVTNVADALRAKADAGDDEARRQRQLDAIEDSVCRDHRTIAYTITGDRTEFVPQDVYSDGQHICLVMGPDVGLTTPLPLPHVGPASNPEVAHWGFRHGILRIDGAPGRIELVDGTRRVVVDIGTPGRRR